MLKKNFLIIGQIQSHFIKDTLLPLNTIAQNVVLRIKNFELVIYTKYSLMQTRVGRETADPKIPKHTQTKLYI